MDSLFAAVLQHADDLEDDGTEGTSTTGSVVGKWYSKWVGKGDSAGPQSKSQVFDPAAPRSVDPETGTASAALHKARTPGPPTLPVLEQRQQPPMLSQKTMPIL